MCKKKKVISQYPKIMCIVLSRWKSNETKIKWAVQYPLGGLFGSVHHKANRGKSGHYSHLWTSRFKQLVLLWWWSCMSCEVQEQEKWKCASRVYEVSCYSILCQLHSCPCALQQSSSTQWEWWNSRRLTQTKIPPPHHQQSPPHHQSKDRTNLPMKVPRLRQSICTHRMILQTILPHPSQNIVIVLWIHFLWQAVILHIKNNALVRDIPWRPALLKGAVRWCTSSAIMIGWVSIVTTCLLVVSMSAGSTAIVIKGGCTSKQAKFRVLKMDVSQDQSRQPDR